MCFFFICPIQLGTRTDEYVSNNVVHFVRWFFLYADDCSMVQPSNCGYPATHKAGTSEAAVWRREDKDPPWSGLEHMMV